METSFILDIVQNIALLLAFSMMYDYFWAAQHKKLLLRNQIITGLLLSGVGVILISTPWVFQDGIIFDARTILLSISGLFFGTIPTLIAIVLLSVFRYSLGGNGVWMGLVTIISSGVIGILWRTFRPDWKTKNQYLELLVLGAITHVVMLLGLLLLPIEFSFATLFNLLPIVFVVYPIATLLLGLLMIKQLNNRENKEALKISEERWHAALEGVGDFLWDFDVIKDEFFLSDEFKKLIGLDETRKTFSWTELENTIHPDYVDKIRLEFWKLKNNQVQVFEVEIKVKKSDGEYAWILDRGKVMTRDESAKVTRCIGTLSDVTHQKQIEDSLYESQLELKNFAAHLHNVREEERVHLAREIHDELGQTLVAVKMDIGMLQAKSNKSECNHCSAILKDHLGHISQLVDISIESSRRIMSDLRPEVIDILGVIDAIRQYCVIFEKRYNIICIFDAEIDNVELEKEHELALFRIVQEALNNVVKHAQATEVVVLLVLDEEGICLEISDNGIGFDVNEQSKHNSFGLIGMKERTFLFGGSLSIESDSMNGTKIKIDIPYNFSFPNV